MAMASKIRTAFEWNIETTKILIALYEENELLYNNLHPDYKDRNKRLALLVKFSNLISEITGKICLVADVRKKISNLRSQYLAEKLKIIKTKSGSSGDTDIYTPSAYWFPLLKFLDSASTADESKTNLDGLDDSINCLTSMETQDSNNNEALCGKPPQTKKMKKRCHDDSDLLIREAATTMRNMCQLATKNSTNSTIDKFCQFVASELNSILECSSMTYVKRAKRDIQKVLFNIWDEIDGEERASSLKNYPFEDSSLVQRNDPEIDADKRTSSLKNYTFKECSPVQNDPEVDADQRVSSLKNYSFKDPSMIQNIDPEINADKMTSSLKNDTFKDFSPVQNAPAVEADQKASSLKNYSFKDSSPVQNNDPKSNKKNYSVANSLVLRNDISRNFTSSNNTPVSIPISVTKKISGKPNIIILKKNHYKSKPNYTITADASEEIVDECDQYDDNV